jgi:hypothetical protein
MQSTSPKRNVQTARQDGKPDKNKHGKQAAVFKPEERGSTTYVKLTSSENFFWKTNLAIAVLQQSAASLSS